MIGVAGCKLLVSIHDGKVLKIIYERGLFHLSIDYGGEKPPPVFLEEDLKWIHTICSIIKKPLKLKTSGAF